MTDMMPCQLCGQKAYTDCDEYDDFYGHCDSCRVRGPATSHSVMLKHGYDMTLMVGPTSRLDVAIIEWNEMKAILARGKLVEAMPSTKGARL